MATVVNSIGILGLEGYLINVEVSIYSGLAMTSIVGLGDGAVKEAKERVETCLNKLDYIYPKKKIVINLSPSDIKKSGSYFDLAIIIGILLESEQIYPQKFNMGEYIFLGEISLNGELKSIHGVLPMVIAAKKKGFTKIILPSSCRREGSVVGGMEIFSFDNINQIINFMEKNIFIKSLIEPESSTNEMQEFKIDFSDVYGNRDIIEYVAAAAAGNHNFLMVGAPGCGKSMIAKRMPTILPQMTEEEVLETTSIYSICGLLKDSGLITSRPFRSPHYNASSNALIGGGMNAMPGEISLSHNGILFLDELPQFSRNTLEALRQPLEDRCVTISRVKYTNVFPANFQLVAAMNPCPCGHHGTGNCNCSPYEIKRYTQRISGPILDRIDIQKYLGKVNLFEEGGQPKNLTSAEIKGKVEMARNIQLERFKTIKGITSNGQMESAHIKAFCPLDTDSLNLLQRSYEKFQFSARTHNKIIKISRTFADMDGSKEILKQHMIYGLMARDLDKDKSNMLVLK